MATFTNPNLTLTTVDDRVTIRVRGDATFNKLERQLSGLGKTWHSHVTVNDFDGGASAGAVLVDFPHQSFAVTVGNSDQVLPFDQSQTVDRAVLQGDAGSNTDELKAVIRIHSPQVLAEFTDDVVSEEEDLLG